MQTPRTFGRSTRVNGGVSRILMRETPARNSCDATAHRQHRRVITTSLEVRAGKFSQGGRVPPPTAGSIGLPYGAMSMRPDGDAGTTYSMGDSLRCGSRTGTAEAAFQPAACWKEASHNQLGWHRRISGARPRCGGVSTRWGLRPLPRGSAEDVCRVAMASLLRGGHPLRALFDHRAQASWRRRPRFPDVTVLKACGAPP